MERPGVFAVLAALAVAAVFGAVLTVQNNEVLAEGLPETIRRIKPAIVGVGTHMDLRQPPSQFRGTGFAVGDGTYVLTNAHVVAKPVDRKGREILAVFVGTGRNAKVRPAKKVAVDKAHDVAVLKISGPPLPTLTLGADSPVNEGQEIAFTGFPIGSVLGLYPVTHRGIVSALTPIAIPQSSPKRLNPAMIRQLKTPFRVLQLDATAYPGNSGSPLYDPQTGRVLGIVSSVFVKSSKENVLKDPSGITYAVPIRFGRALLKKAGALR